MIELGDEERLAVEPREDGGVRLVVLYLDPWERWQLDARSVVLTRDQARELVAMLQEVCP